jgi:class 3 adenylate cyclase
MSHLLPAGCVDIGTPHGKARTLLAEHGFDFGLVRDSGKVVGYVQQAALSPRARPLKLGPPVRALTVEHVAGESTPISDLIGYLARVPFQVVMRKKDAVGIVHQSDLNKHPACLYFTYLCGRLEQNLLSILSHTFSDRREWKGLLAKHRWRTVNATWRSARRRDLDVDPLFYLRLSDYLRIAGKHPEALQRLGFQSRRQWDECAHGVRLFSRNVLHPHHMLVGEERTVADLLRLDQSIHELVSRAELGTQQQLLAIMFIDIVGSTEFSDQHGDAAGVRMVQSFLKTLSPIVQQHSGWVVKTIGDAIMASFSSAEAAVRCAIKAQWALAKQSAPGPAPHRMRIRAGIGYGAALIVQNDVFGDTVNVAARILGVAGPSEIAISSAVYKHIANLRDIPVQLKAKRMPLKGKKEGIDVHVVDWAASPRG